MLREERASFVFPRLETEIEAKQLAAYVAQLGDLKKAENITVLDVSEHIRVADYFVLLSCISRPHVKAVSQEIHIQLKSAGEMHKRPEGDDLRWWTLLDYGDVVVHVLQSDAREYYDLDRLYQECPKLEWESVSLPAELPGLGDAATGS